MKWKQQQQQIKLKLMDPRPYHYQYRKPRYSNPTFQSNHLYESIYQSGLYTKPQGSNEKIYNSPSYNNFTPQYKYVPENLKISQQLPNNQNTPNTQEIQNGRVNEYAQRYSRKDEAELKNNYKNGNQYANADTVDKVSRSMIMEPKPQQLRYAQMQRKQSQNRIYQEGNKETIQKMREEAKNSYRNGERANSEMRSYSQDKPSTNNSKGEDDLGQISNYGTRIIRPMPGKYQDYIFEKQQKPYNIISYYPKRDENRHRVYPKLTLEDKLLETGQMPGQNANPQFFRY